MRFLCLHGNGSNSHVMDLQTAPLRHELEDEHEYEFLEATLQAPMSEVQGVEALSSPNHNFFTFYNRDDLSTLHRAMSQLDDFISSEGPYDAVMAFSAGAVLVAAYLLEKERVGGPLPFKFGVFLSSADSSSERRYLGVDASSRLIKIPTAHIWGFNDLLAPTGGEDLSKTCDPTLRHTLVHNGGHEIPRKEHLTEIVHLIRRTAYAARY